jgi:hypothetical protein
MRAQQPRSAPRRRCYLGGRIAYANRFVTVNCLVRDISPKGARLVLPEAELLPSEFDLDIREKKGFRARIVWRQGNVCGVEFLESRPARAYEPTFSDAAAIGA